MPTVKTLGISLAVLVGVGVVVGSLTWAFLTTRGPPPPELKPLDWWEHTVIYQIYPRSFKDSDGDGIGDVKGITSKLDHFVEAGVGAIWMSPVFVSPMVDFGYDISDFYNIQEEYGTMADFEELVDKAHSLGIKVILDYVPNHASDQSMYFIQSEARNAEYENYFVWADPIIEDGNRTVPSNWISQFGGSVWEWNEARQQYYLHQFAKEQVDFNFREPKVRKEMLNIMKFWFEKGADGFRLDALPHLFEADPNDYGGKYPDEPLSGNLFLNPNQAGYTTQEFVRDQIELYDVLYEWRAFADKWREDNNAETKILLAEAYANISMTMLYYGAGRTRGAHFPFNFDFITSLSADSNARDFFGNHDKKRMASRFRTNMVDGLNSLNMMLPGVAITYQGEEIGMRDGYVSWEDTVDVQACNQATEENYLEFSRDPARTPYQWDGTAQAGFSTGPKTWLPVAEDYREINLQAQKEASKSHFKVYTAMTKLRKEPALSHGNYFITALSEDTLVLVRYLVTHDTYALVFNVGTTNDTVDISKVEYLKEPLTVHISSVHSNKDGGDTITFGNITLKPGEALVLRAPPV